jgi:fumarate reductase flavoprotein subunit
MGGVKIDGRTRVVGVAGDAIAGLYAAGEATGGIHGANRLGANAVSDIITFGRLAGEQAARYARAD